MPIIDFHDMDELRNRNEELVWKAIEDYLNAHPQVCRCRDCILDAAALTLNSLTPRYHVYSFHDNTPGEKDASSGVAEAVARAFEKVTRRPHH